MLNKKDRKRWFVKFPLHLYVEDVKQIAKDNDLIIVDKKFENDPALKGLATKVEPKITLKSEVKNTLVEPENTLVDSEIKKVKTKVAKKKSTKKKVTKKKSL